MHKTQVFIAPEGDHYRTRLTHTLEVVGIARTVARALRLNEDLAEAIGLGHDLGPPAVRPRRRARARRGAARALRAAASATTSSRCASSTSSSATAAGSTSRTRCATASSTTPGRPTPESLEGRIVKIVDRVAYINHDIDDAIRAGVLDAGELPAGPVALLGDTGSARIDRLVHDLVETLRGRRRHPPERAGRPRRCSRCARSCSSASTVRARCARRPTARGFVVRSLFDHFCDHPADMDDGDPELDAAARVTDHVAGMTDRYALRRFEELLLPLAQAGP